MIKSLNDYSRVFSCTRSRIHEDLCKDVEHVKNCNKMGLNVSLQTICYMADDLTAYNELSSITTFLKLNYIMI